MGWATSNSVPSTWVGELPPEEVIFGSSPAMEEIRRNVERAASADIPVLLQGKSGTGKEVLAKFLHRRSRWGNGAFVKVHCPALPSALIESELFGYEKGSFTGAYETKRGRVELAHEGTLFLDEIAEMDLGLQAKLLQLLQDGQFSRIGAQEDRQVKVRVICATNRRLQQEVKSGTFRQDLFYRINALTMELPTLPERSGDIPMLLAYFLEKYSKKYGYPVRPFSSSFLRQLHRYRWPGNIRELENVVQRYVILGSEQIISNELEDGSPDFLTEIPLGEVIQLKKVTQQAVKQLERTIIARVLKAKGWNRRSTARALSISYGALLQKMKEAGLQSKRSRARDHTAARPNWAAVDAAEVAPKDVAQLDS
jgi:two-component system response regulator AtoC